MKTAPRAPESEKVAWLHHDAGENLRFIRESMERGTVFTGLSGRGYVVGGFTALPAAWLAGGLLSFHLHLAGATKALPALWLTVYGAAVITAGAWSIRLIPLMGACFMLLGALAAFTPLNQDVLLALGFDGLHMGFGLWIWRAHGG